MYDNLLAALNWFARQQMLIHGAEMVWSLRWFWYFRGMLGEVKRQATVFLALPDAMHQELACARLYWCIAASVWVLGDYKTAYEMLTKGRALAEAAVDAQTLAYILIFQEQATTVDRGFRFLQDALFFADSLFLKSPARTMAMIMIMGLCLLIYALAEWRVREQLQAQNQTIPDQKGKPTQTPTMRRVAQMFEGVDLLIIRQGTQIVERQILKLTPVSLQLIRLLGPAVQNCCLVDF